MYETFTQPLLMMPSTHTSNTRLIRSLFTRWLRSFAGFFFLACLLLVGQKAFATGVPAAHFLLPNGTLNTAAIGKQQLSLDLKGWNVHLDPKMGPVFAPAADGFSALDKGLNASVTAIAISGSDVYVGGVFTAVGTGGTAVTGLNNIAKWNTTTSTWSALDKGLNNDVYTIAISGSDVYVGGGFTAVGTGGTAVTGLNKIAKWNTTTSAWSALASGLNDRVNAIAISGSDVYVGGGFTQTGSNNTTLFYIAKWNGTAWSALASGLDADVNAITISGSDVYVGGGFSGAIGSSLTGLNKIAKWNGTAWSALDKGLNNSVNAIAISGSDVYVGGYFTAVGTGGTAVTGLNKIAKWNTTTSTWSALDKGLNNIVNAIAISGSDVYVGGWFTAVGTGGTTVTGLNGIAKWNGTAWSALDKGLNGNVDAIAISGSGVCMGGGFTAVGTGGTAVSGLNSIAKWGAVATPTLAIGTAISPTNCTTPNGSIAFTSTGIAAGNQTLNYKKDAVDASATVTVAANGTFTLSGLGAGAYTNFAIGATTATGNRTLEQITKPDWIPGTIASVSNTATSFIIPNNGASQDPNRYSIVVGTPNAMPGFTPVSDAVLGFMDPITVTIPAGVAGGTYNFNLTVSNSTTGCVSDVIPVALMVTAPVANGPSCSTFTNKTTTNGLGNNSVLGVYVEGTTVYAATQGGLSISTDGGATFTNRTTTNGLGNNNVYGVYAVGTTVYAATGGGLSISTNGGATFTNRTTTNGLGDNYLNGVYAVGTTVYAATNFGLSISTDGGATFTNRTKSSHGLGETNVFGVYAVGTTVYAATAGGGLSISTDGGATFTNRTTTSGLGNNTVYGVYVVGTTVYAATFGGLSISTNGGATFTNRTTINGLGNNIVRGVYVVGTTVYAATGGGLSISTDGGATFTNRTTTNGLGNNNVYGVYAVGTTVYAATGGGLSNCSSTTLTIGMATNPTTCVPANGSIAFTSTGFAAGNQTLNYSKDGTPTSATVTIAADGTFTLTGLGAGDYTAFAIGATTATGTNPTLTPPNQTLPPTITPPAALSVCSPSTLTLTASGCAGVVTWSNNSTGTSLMLSAVGTYAISATCTVNGCISDASTTVNGLEIKAKPNAPTITPPAALSVCSPSTLTLTASGCAGVVTWSNNSTGTSLMLSAVGTYAISATCTVNGCTSDASTTVNGLEIKAKPNAPTITPPAALSVCSPSTLTLTASGCAGTVTWSNNSTGTSLTLSAVGTYAISATCTVNGCTSDASTTVNGLEIKAKPNAPTITPPAALSVCSPSTLTLTASGCAGTVTWSNNSTGTSLTLSAVGTYAISATCTVNGCTSDASTTVNGLEIKAKPNAPTITPPAALSVCSPSTLTLTASGCAGTVTWSNNSTGTSLTLSAVGTYAISATCTVNGCTSDASTTVSGLEIKAKPNAPTITPPAALSVCSPSTLTLTASGCAGTVTWSNNSTGTSLTLSAVGTYAISATCTVNGCTSDASNTVNGLEIKALPIITASNTGPYTVGQTVSLIGTGVGSYNWTGPNNFSSTLSSPTISNALSVNSGVYTLSVTGINGCNAMATTNVIVSGVDPCDPSRVVDYSYVKAGNPYQTLFSLTNGMVINQRTDQVSILVNPVCPTVAIESFEMNIQGPELNWNIIQNAPLYALFDNFGNDVWGRNFKPGVYTLTVTGYAQDNKGGGVTYGPKIITFTVVGDLATINAPTLSKAEICAGSTVDVTFTTTGTFVGINQFQVELSDSSGSFTNPILIGTTTTAGTLNCTIPQNTVEGAKYLIRVSSTNQVVVGNPAMSLVTVHPLSYSLVNPTNNLTGTSTKKAVNTINASNKVTSPANVTYQAGKNILLTPGFESGAVFKAEIQGCN